MGQPVDRDAVEGAHPDGAPGEAVELGHLLLELPLRVAHRPQAGQQGLAGGGEGDPRPSPDEQGHPPLLFQVGNDAAHRALGVAQVLRRPGDAAQLRRPQQGTIFSRFHRHHPFCFGMRGMTKSRLRNA